MKEYNHRLDAYLRRSEEISERLMYLLVESIDYELDEEDIEEIDDLKRQMLINHTEAFRLN